MNRVAARALCAVVALAFHATPARADAIYSHPVEPCPSGSVEVWNHGNRTCAGLAPADCPPGWKGVPGPSCALDVCDDDATCTKGTRCVEQSICFSPPSGHTSTRRPFDLCSPETKCAIPSECAPSKICLAAGAKPATFEIVMSRPAVASPSPPPRVEKTSSCACTTSPSAPGLLGGMAALGALGALAGRWARRREPK